MNVALPSIRRDLEFSVQGLQWVLSGYLLTYGGLLLLGIGAAVMAPGWSVDPDHHLQPGHRPQPGARRVGCRLRARRRHRRLPGRRAITGPRLALGIVRQPAGLRGDRPRCLPPSPGPALEHKFDTVGYGIFIPIFFITSGMTLGLKALSQDPLRLLLFFGLLLIVHGLPSLLVYRRALRPRQRLEMTFITATTMPLLIALAEIGQRDG
jgi:Sodium/hydrogen exchanger family